jgi:hypothetical protein
MLAGDGGQFRFRSLQIQCLPQESFGGSIQKHELVGLTSRCHQRYRTDLFDRVSAREMKGGSIASEASGRRQGCS